MKPNDRDVNESMRRYYEERAAEYEHIYSGGHPDSIHRPSLFQHDASAVAALLPGLVGPVHLDLACGTGYWLSFYRPSCRRITLIDRSAAMLAECRKKIDALPPGAVIELVRADVLSHRLPENEYDSALIGFLWSHLTQKEETSLFTGVRRALKPGGRLLLLDSAWSEERAAARPKSSVQTRTLSDGRSFSVRKRYLDEEELQAMGKRYGMEWSVPFQGKAFLLAVHRKPRPA